MTGMLLTLPQLLAFGGVVLVAMGVSSWLLLREDKLSKQLGSRIETVATSYARVNPLTRMARQRDKVAYKGLNRVWAGFGVVFGFDLSRSSYYPMRIPFAVLASLLFALALGHALAALLGVFGRIIALAAWPFLSRKLFATFEQRRANKLYNQLPDALAMIVRAVRVGIPVSESIRTVAKEGSEPTAGEFAILGDQLTVGTSLEDALRECATRNRLAEYRFFATALSLQQQTGGGLSETLENLAEVIRKRVAVRNRAYAMAAEARMSMYVLAALPFLVTGALSLVAPDYIGLLFTETLGNYILGGAIFMLSIGMLAMKTIISKVLK